MNSVKSKAQLCALAFLLALSVCLAALLPAPVEAAIIKQYQYKLWSHPDGNAAPPSYGLRLDGIEWFVTGQGGNSDTWTFDFIDMKGTYTYNSGGLDTFRIYGTAVGGRDLSGSGYDNGESAKVYIDFTVGGYGGHNSHVDPEIEFDQKYQGVAERGAGTITFKEAVHSIEKDTQVELVSYANSAGNYFNFDRDPVHRLGDYCSGGNPPAYCGMPEGWGWLALRDEGWDYHTAAQDFLFVSKKAQSVPEPASLALLLVGLGMISVLKGARSGRCRTEA